MTTEAGRALLEASTPDASSAEFGVRVGLHSIIRHAVPRIEAEAVAAERKRLRAAVAGLVTWTFRDGPPTINRAAVLAMLDEPPA